MQGRIMLVDDDQTSLAMLRACLEQVALEVEIVGQATDAEHALKTAMEIRPDVVLVDFTLPRLTGVEAARWIMRASPETRVILISEYDEPWIRERSTRLGIFGMLKKDQPLVDLRRMVEHALQAPRFRKPTSPGARPAATQRAEPPIDERSSVPLSPAERRVLRLAVAGHTTQGIADQLGIARQTVRDHFKHIYSKLGVHSRAQALLVFKSLTS